LQKGVAKPRHQNKSTLALQRVNDGASRDAKLTREQIRSIFLSAAIPMVGFGFMDNFIMITAGSAIDNSLGVQMGLATMTAAAIGQVVSDVSGVVFGDTLSRVFKVAPAKLRSSQKKLVVVRRLRLGGAVLGVIVGCTMGAAALCLIPETREESEAAAATRAVALSSLSERQQQETVRDQLRRLHRVMTDVMTSEDDKWSDRRASCTLFVNESMDHCIPKTTPRSSFFAHNETPANIDRMKASNDPAVLHTLEEGRAVVFTDTIYVPVLGADDTGTSGQKVLGIFKIKLENGSFYSGSEIKDAKRVARNIGFFLDHMV